MYGFIVGQSLMLVMTSLIFSGLAAYLSSRCVLSRRGLVATFDLVGRGQDSLQGIDMFRNVIEQAGWYRRVETGRLQADYRVAGYTVPLSQWIAITLLAASGLGLFVSLTTMLILGQIVFFATILISRMVIQNQANHRRAMMIAQLPVALEHIAFSVDAGLHLMQAIDKAIDSLDIPVSAELKMMRERMACGATFAEAMHHMDDKWQLAELHKISIALTLHSRYGGNIKALLVRAAAQMRQSESLRSSLEAQTAQGKLSMKIVMLAPIVLVVILSVLMPGFFDILTGTSAGQGILAGAILLDIIGYHWIKTVIKVRW